MALWNHAGPNVSETVVNWPGRERPFSLDAPRSAGRSGIFALGVGPDGRLWSWWELAEPQTADAFTVNGTRRWYAYRHDAKGAAEAAGEWAETWTRQRSVAWRGEPLFSIRRIVWSHGEAWILRGDGMSNQGATLTRLRLNGEVGPVFSLPFDRKRSTGMPDAAEDAWSRIWLWAAGSLSEGTRYLGVFDGERFDWEPRIENLPDGEITHWQPAADGRSAVVAVRGAGLWDVDLKRLRANARVSPGLKSGDSVIAWQAWPDGVEVVLVKEPAFKRDWTSVWIRESGGWTKRGGFPRESIGLLRNASSQARAFGWCRAKGWLLMTGQRNLWAWPITGTSGAPRRLDWRIDLETTGAAAAYVMNDNRILILGGSERRFAPTALPAGHGLRGLLRSPHSPIEHSENALPSGDGAIWTRRQVGADKMETLRWREGKWTSWQEPDEVRLWDMFALDSLGRVWIYDNMDRPAAMLDPLQPEQGYQTHTSLRKLLETEAASGRDFILRATHDYLYRDRPVVWGGAVLVSISYRHFELWRAGKWTVLPEIPGGLPSEIGFAGTGNPWGRVLGQQPRKLDAAGAWVETASDDGMRFGWKLVETGFESSRAPDWLRSEIEKYQAGYAAPWQDSRGDWWAVLNNGLLRGREGLVWSAIRKGVPNPWSAGVGHARRVERMPDGSMQFWAGDSVTLVPAAALAKPPSMANSVFERRKR